jgi:hypothetical protein
MEVLKQLIRQCVSLPEDQVFDKLMEKINDYAHNVNYDGKIADLKKAKVNKNKLKGDIFEIICLELLKNGCLVKCQEAWLFKDLPLELRKRLSFNDAKDVGIDIVIHLGNDVYSAVQCKYRSESKHKSVNINKDGQNKKIRLKWQVTWEDLSTFYSLCDRTGIPGKGWNKYIVMTTAESVNRKGRKNYKDLSICNGSFRGLPKDAWFTLLGDKGNTIMGSNIELITEDNITQVIFNLTLEETEPEDKEKEIKELELMRRKRLERLGNH